MSPIAICLGFAVRSIFVVSIGAAVAAGVAEKGFSSATVRFSGTAAMLCVTAVSADLGAVGVYFGRAMLVGSRKNSIVARLI